MYNLWQTVLEEIRHNTSEAVFAMWFKGTKLLSGDDKDIVVGVPSVFFINALQKKYHDLVVKALDNCGVKYSSIKYVVDSSTKGRVVPKEVTRGSQRDDRSVVSMVDLVPKTPRVIVNDQSSETGLSDRYRFDNYVVGENNELAMSVAEAIVNKPGRTYNPLYVYGGPGLGKTHLIQAIGNEILKRHKGVVTVKYVTVEQFFRAHIQSAKTKQDLSDVFRRFDVLIIDDIQFIAGKDGSQIDFFHAFNELFMSGRQIIISSDRMPSELKFLDARLVSRMMQGMTVDIQMPNFETRCAILKSKAEWDGIILSDEAVEYVANSVRTNIRELEGMLNQLIAYSQLKQISPDEVIQEGYLSSNQAMKITSLTPKQVVEKTAAYYRLKPEEIYSKSRVKEIIIPRQVAMYIMKEELGMSYPKIGREFGQKDHTSALNSVRKISKAFERDSLLREGLATIKNSLFVER